MAIKEIKSDDFEQEVEKSKGGAVVDFYANWCGPCKMLRPILEEISNEHPGVKFLSIDVDEADELAYKFGVSSIPCVVFFRDGVEVNRLVGIRPKVSFEEALLLIE